LRSINELKIIVVFLFLIEGGFLFVTGVDHKFSYNSIVTYTNKGSQPLELTFEDRVFNIFMNTSWQTVKLLSCNLPYSETDDLDGNPIIVLSVPSVPQDENIILSVNLEVITKEREAPDVNYLSSGSRDQIPKKLIEDFCKSAGTWLYSDELKSLAHQIWNIENQTDDVLKIVCSLADWIGENIEYESFEGGLYPNETYQGKRGDCDDQANLLITLCRILDIPAFLQLGCIHSLDFPENETYWDGHLITYYRLVSFHAWAVVYIPPWGWLPFDMTWGWTSEDSLDGVKTAVAYSESTIIMMNVTKSDWPGSARRLKERLINSDLYVFDVEELTILLPGTLEERFWREIELWVITVTIIISVFFLVARSRGCSQKSHL